MLVFSTEAVVYQRGKEELVDIQIGLYLPWLFVPIKQFN